jgi:class 3 adenylate cyclase
VLVSAECWRYLSNAFPGECRGSIQVKGFSEPIEVYQIDLETTGPLVRTEEVRTT